MLFCGDTNSPDKLAPDIIPVTPENKTPKTMKKSTSTEGSEQSLEYLEVLSTIVIYFRLLKIIKEQGQSKGQTTNNVTTSMKETKNFNSYFGKEPLRNHKRGGRGLRKWQFLITFSTESNFRKGRGSENPKS